MIYKVTLSIVWNDEAKARLWCKEHSILFKMDDSALSYEETMKEDEQLDDYYLNIVKNDVPLNRIFCFKYEEDAVAFKLRWV